MCGYWDLGKRELESDWEFPFMVLRKFGDQIYLSMKNSAIQK